MSFAVSRVRTAFPAGRCIHHQRPRRAVTAVSNKYVLVPTGDGSIEHLGGETAERPAAVNLAEGVFEVGRVSEADVVISIPTVSSRHAIIRIEEERIAVTDLNSTNGTMVNGVELDALQAATVQVGDEVVFGDEHLAKFRLELAPVTAPTEAAPTESASPAADAEPVAA